MLSGTHTHGESSRLIIGTHVTRATSTVKQEAVLAMARTIPGPQRVTSGADQNDDVHDFVREQREWQVTLHMAQHSMGRSNAIDERTTHHPGYAVRQWTRQCVEEIVGLMKTVGLLHEVRHCSVAWVG
jgi:hypothetical protein